MKYWTTQAGEKLRPKDMETSHIENCIRMLQRILDEKPEHGYYMGDSVYAEEALEQENMQNDDMEREILSNIRSFKRVLKNRL